MTARLPRLLLIAALFGAGPLVGEVFEARLRLPDGRAAAGFRILVVGRPGVVNTDSDGVFRLDPAPVAPFQMIAVGPGEELSAPIEVTRVAPVRVELVAAPVARDTVTVVSGVSPGLDLLPAGAAVVVTGEALEQRPPQRLVDAVDSVPGASKLGDGADSVPSLRGLARGRTLILVDGVRIASERRAGPSATFVAPASLAAVEVVRGPGSVVYGSDAFGGLINAVTRDPEPGATSLSWALEGAAGGWNQWSGSAAVSGGAGEGALGAEVHFESAADGKGGDGETIRNSSFHSRGAAVRWISPVGSGQARASVASERVGDLGKAAIDSQTVRSYYPREEWDRLRLAWAGTGGGSWDQIDTTASYGRYRVVLHRDRAATPDATRRIDTSDTRAEDASLRLVAGRPAGGGRLQVGFDAFSRFGLEVAVGRVELDRQGREAGGSAAEAALRNGRQVTTGLFSTWTLQVAERWTLGVGGRGDRVESSSGGGYFGARSGSASELSGNVAITWASGEGTVATAQVARGFRVPTLSDRFYRGPSGRGFVTGNPDLAAETSLQWDLAVRRRAGAWATSVFLYRYEIAGLVERYRVGEDYFFRNRGSALIDGAEVELQGDLDERWRVEAGGSWTRSRAAVGEPLADAPAPGGSLGLHWTGERSYGFVRWAVRLEKRDPGPAEVGRAGFGRVDLGWGHRLGRELELRFALANALDRAYTASPDETADRAAGRAWTVGLSGRW